MSIPQTNDWQSWRTISKRLSLTAGTHHLKVALHANGSGGAVGNINWIRVR